MNHKCTFATLAALATTFASAATLIVTSAGDDGSAGTLRGAIAAAADGDTITFDATLAGGTIALDKTLGPLEYAGTLTIEGPASAPVTIDGGAGSVDQGIAYAGNSRTTYLIHATGTAATTTLRNLVFTGSKANQSKDTPDVGPAVSILGNAVVDNCCWTNNGVARSGNFGSSDGGGCLRVGGNLTLENSRFNKNGVSAGSSNYSLGAAVLAKGATVVVRNCEFSETYGWGGSTTGSGNDIAALAVGSATTSLTVEGCVFERNLALHGGGALFVAGGSGSFSVRNSRFVENKNTNAGIKHGGALTFGGAGSYLVENCEFADNYSANYGGAVRSESPSANVVFANCTFVNNDGNNWGGAVDTRGPTWYVNCTAAGNVNRASNNNGSGTFFSTEKSTVNILNGALVWNWSNNGTVKNDTSKYGATVNVYNSYNYPAGTAPSKEESVTRNYDENTAFFAEPLASISSMTCFGNTYNFSQSITTPVLSPAADAATPRTIEIDRNGVLLSTGWPVRHDADWSNIAYSKDSGETWIALRGSADAATIPLAADSRGVAYAVSGGIPVTPIGSATVPRFSVTWDVATNGGEWSGGSTATATDAVYRGDAPVVPADPEKSGWNFIGWSTDPNATTALDMMAQRIAADTAYYAIFEEISATDAIVHWFDEDGATALLPASTLVPDGTQPTHDEPSKVQTDQYTYAFAGWTEIGGDGTVYTTANLPIAVGGATISYKAVYEATLRSYTIVFKDADGTVISSEAYDYGTTAAQIVVPTLETKTTYEYTYAFASWDKTVADVTGDATYTAVYSSTANLIALDTANYRFRISMTASGYDGEGSIENFPVLVRLSSAIHGFDASTVSDPSEIRFADANGNLIPHEIDTWDPVGESTIWVSVPTLSGKDTTITMFWKPVDRATQQTALTPSRVWTQAGYLGVWHFSPATELVYANSAQPEHYATASVAATEGANGIIGVYVQFPNGATTLVNDSIAWVDYTPHMTLEFWVDRQNKGDARIFGSGANYTEGASIYMSGYISGNGGHSHQQSSLIPATGWRHVSMNFSGSAQANALADGVTPFTFSKQGGSSIDGNGEHFFHNVNDGSIYADYHALSLTSHGNGEFPFKGYADEFRLRGENSTAEWMQANYDTQAPGTDFLAYGKVHQSSGLTIIVR